MNKQHITAINEALFEANQAALKAALNTSDNARSQRLLEASDIIGEMQDILNENIHKLAKSTI